MSDPQSSSDNGERSRETEVLNSLVSLIINQDVVLASWAKFFLTIQSALFAGFGYVVLKPIEAQADVRSGLATGACILGIFIVIAFWLIFTRESQWQKFYVRRVAALPSLNDKIYSKWDHTNNQRLSKESEPELKWGLSVGSTIHFLSALLVVFWLTALYLSINWFCCA